MEVNTRSPQNFQMILRLKDNRPVLVLPRYAQHSSPEPNNPTFKTSDPHQKRDFETTTTHCTIQNPRTQVKTQKGGVVETPEEKVDNNCLRSAPENLKKMESWQLQHKEKPGKRSLVEDLLNLMNQNEEGEKSEGQKNRLEKLEWVETNSFHEGESYDFDDNLSEIMQLTQEERIFFTNFVHHTPQEEQPREEEPFIDLELIPAVVIPQKSQEQDHLPANKTKVTRNFFRSKLKPSMIKDHKTCCNSQTFMEEQLKQGKQKLDISIEIPDDKLPL